MGLSGWIDAALARRGCAFEPVLRPLVDVRVGFVSRGYSLGRDLAQEMALEAARGLGFGPAARRLEGRMLVSRPRALPSPGNCDCGQWNGRSVSGVVSCVLVLGVVSPRPGRSRVWAQALYCAGFTGRNRLGIVTRRECYLCASTGRQELRFFRRFEGLLPAGAAD